MKSLYGQYLKERCNKEIIESEKGFASYYFFEDKCYVEDIYVAPEYRRTKEATIMLQSIETIAKSNGYKILVGTVVPSTFGSTESMKAALDYGFRLDSCVNNFIAIRKDI